MPLALQCSLRLNRFFNMLLKAAAREEPDFMSKLQQLFAESRDIDGYLDLTVIIDFFSRSTWMLDIKALEMRDPRAIVIPEIRMPASSADSFTQDIISALELDTKTSLRLPEFMLEYLGRSKYDVELHLYDVSDGLALKLSPWVASESVAGVWHTSVVVYGKEFFWNSVLRFDTPGMTSWGEASKRLHMGTTWFREDEFVRFMVREVHPVFTKEAYNLLSFNCNHCSDRLCLWLTGNHVPDSILNQASNFLEDGSIGFLKPLVERLFIPPV